MDKGDTAWMMISTILVLFMILPGLALFYGGLVRSKNMLSVLMQCTMITATVIIVWIFWGYSMAFGDAPSAFWGGLGKSFLAGVTADSQAATFTAGVVIPEYVFICFQMTFACITPALIVGAFAERIKFRSVILFVVLWVTFVYFPIAHMVWDSDGLIYGWGALDFAGGTVVHINAGIAALAGSIMVGKRLGYGKDNMAPHSMTLTMVGASMLWVGWFGFNAGSNLEANGGAALAMINTFTATAGAIVAWVVIEGLIRGKASMLGAASGMVAGLVAVTPASGYAGPMGAIVLGAARQRGLLLLRGGGEEQVRLRRLARRVRHPRHRRHHRRHRHRHPELRDLRRHRLRRPLGRSPDLGADPGSAPDDRLVWRRFADPLQGRRSDLRSASGRRSRTAGPRPLVARRSGVSLLSHPRRGDSRAGILPTMALAVATPKPGSSGLFFFEPGLHG